MRLSTVAVDCGSLGHPKPRNQCISLRLLACRGARREVGLMRHVCLAFMVIGDDGLDHGKLPREDQAGIESVDSRRHTASLFNGFGFIKFSIMRFHAVSRPQHDTTSVLAFHETGSRPAPWPRFHIYPFDTSSSSRASATSALPAVWRTRRAGRADLRTCDHVDVNL
jgi:hypothetical protein